jgi:hypothetical protein
MPKMRVAEVAAAKGAFRIERVGAGADEKR